MQKQKNLYQTLAVIFALAGPTMLEQLMQTAVQYIDTAMVGALGTEATAAVGSTTTVNWLVNSTVSALGIGFLAFISQALGAGDRKSACRASAQAVTACVILGAILTIVTLSLSPFIPYLMQVDESISRLSATYFFIMYTPMLPRSCIIIFGTLLRAAGDTKTPMKAGFMVNIINVILNFFLIFPTRTLSIQSFDLFIPGAGLGVVGAAIASAISFIIGGIYITIALFGHKTLSPVGSRFSPDKAILAPCFKVGIPNMLQRFTTSLGYVVFASMVNSLGETSTAAHTIANTVESAFYIPAYGMQTAAATLSGNAFGARDKNKMNYLCRVNIIIEIALMLISGALLFIFAPFMVGLFSNDSSVISLGTTVLRMVAVSEPFYGVPIILEGVLQGVGETKKPLIFNLIGMWAVRIVGTFICTQMLSLGLISAWGCMIAHNLLLFVLFILYYKNGKWNPLDKE